MDQINFENWNYTSYASKQVQAFISFGASPSKDAEECQFAYCVTVTNFDFEEIYQKSFSELQDALQFINQNYGHWDFSLSRTGKTGDGGGCGSCGAH